VPAGCRASFGHAGHGQGNLGADADRRTYCAAAIQRRSYGTRETQRDRHCHSYNAHAQNALVSGRGIYDYFRHKKQFSSGVLEGLNNKAKVTPSKAYGYRTYRIAKLSLHPGSVTKLAESNRQQPLVA